MSRNGSGSMSIPNTMVSGTTITASDHNENYSDIASELTNSVAVDGQSTMTGPLKAASGTAAAPGVTFGADTNTGAFRSASDEYSVSAGGVQIHKSNADGFSTVTGHVNAATKIKEGGNSLVPSGVIWPYGGSSAPSGFLLCDGSAISRTTYADLFTAISTTYGVGDGSTTFNVPDLGGRVPAGKEATATRLTTAASGVDGGTLGATGGAQSHTLTLPQSAAHNHGGTVGDTASNLQLTGGAASPTAPTTNNTLVDGGQTRLLLTGQPGSTSLISLPHTHTITSAGGGEAHPNVQPTIIVNYIIKT